MRRPDQYDQEDPRGEKADKKNGATPKMDDMDFNDMNIGPEKITPEIAKVIGEKFKNLFLYSELAYVPPEKAKEFASFKGKTLYLSMWTIDTAVANELRNFKGTQIYLKHLKFVMGNAANILNELENRGVKLHVSERAREAMIIASETLTDYPI